MKKFLLCLLILSSYSVTNVYANQAQGYVFTSKDVTPSSVNYSQSLQIQNMPYGMYLKFYNLDSSKINASFIFLSKDEEKEFVKTLTKTEKENYKYAKKVQKLIQKREWSKVFEKYPHYFPAYLQYYNYIYSNGNYYEAIKILNKINSMDRGYQVFSKDLIDYSYGILYYHTNQYQRSLSYLKRFENSGNNFILHLIAQSYYGLHNYNAVISTLGKNIKQNYDDIDLLYSSYYALKNYNEANQYALRLVQHEYNFENLMKVQASASYDNVKLNYAYKARSVAKSDEQIIEANAIIAQFEQKKLDANVAKISQFVKVPDWADFVKKFPENVSVNEVTQKQDEFFKKSNFYLKKYSGQQLTNAFNSLNQDYNEYLRTKQNEYYQAKQLQAQEALVIEQQKNNLLQQELINAQREQNYLQRQRMYYYYSRPYYYGRGYYGWW